MHYSSNNKEVHSVVRFHNGDKPGRYELLPQQIRFPQFLPQVLFVLGFLSTVLGQLLAARYISEAHQAPVIFSVAFVILLSSLAISIYTVMEIESRLKRGLPLLQTGSLCPAVVGIAGAEAGVGNVGLGGAAGHHMTAWEGR